MQSKGNASIGSEVKHAVGKAGRWRTQAEGEAGKQAKRSGVKWMRDWNEEVSRKAKYGGAVTGSLW